MLLGVGLTYPKTIQMALDDAISKVLHKGVWVLPIDPKMTPYWEVRGTEDGLKAAIEAVYKWRCGVTGYANFDCVVRQTDAWDNKDLLVIDPDVLMANADKLIAFPRGYTRYVCLTGLTDQGQPQYTSEPAARVSFYGKVTPEMFTKVIMAKR